MIEAISLVAQAHKHAERLALQADDGSYSYAQLLAASECVAAGLLGERSDLNGERVCYLIAPNTQHVATQWGIFRAGGVAVPLCSAHPAPELAHVLDDARPTLIVAGPEFHERLRPLAQERGLRCLEPSQLLAATPRSLPQLTSERCALLIYTSGTTGKPKAAITTHAILNAQLRAVAAAWELAPSDRILHVLPLHHLHGILNALGAVLYAGGCVEFMPRFDAAAVLTRMTRAPQLSLFMAVPTIYSRLLAQAEPSSHAERAQLHIGLQRLRLMVSGSAALPVSILQRFETLSGHVLLERYGMTELGMALGNPLHGERRQGSVGVPFPGVEARIVDDSGHTLADGAAGELQIRGPNVFAGYFGKPEASEACFTADGFFRTGDVAIREHGYYRLLGRESVDIIKTGGYKVSALEIEESLRLHPAISEVAVVGVPDPEWGERVAAAVVLQPSAALELEQLRAFAKTQLASYKVPSLLICLPDLPRNVMGKVQKPEVKRLWATQSA